MAQEQRVLLAVLAHPDDETFGTGGTLALYARRGVAVHLVCATRGEVGDVDAEHMKGYATVAELRESELRCAAGILGLTGVHFLNYRDSGMPGSVDNSHPQALAAQPVDKVAGEVAHYIRLLRPQVLITFDPIGGYRHPDHIAIQRATVRAFEMLRDGQPSAADDLPPFVPQKMYFSTIPRGFLRFVVRLMRLVGRDPSHFGKNKDIDIASLAEVNFPINARINFKAVASIKDEASACHASQGGDNGLSIGNRIRKLFFSSEMYMRAYPPPVPGYNEKDLFEGIK
ncbi:MAG: PIG-L family deacetylase [Anaerolineaceae bacterium]|nr:PIG-L family deacetylase [Anaerolineaceae bacterium]